MSSSRGVGAGGGRGGGISGAASPASAPAGPPAACSASTPTGGTARAGAAQPLAGAGSLRVCGLPSCGLAEPAPLSFGLCALCNAVAYCCQAHSAAHWRAGHRRECGDGARAGAQPLAADGADAAPPPSAGAVARPPLPPPSPEDVATLRSLVEKCAEKAALKRHGRAAELAGQAADLAYRLYGSDSLVGAALRLRESSELVHLAALEPDEDATRGDLYTRSWGLLLTAIGVIEQRLAAGTLLPGACREAEIQFDAHKQAVMRKVAGAPPLSAADMRDLSVAVGYDTALHAVRMALGLLGYPWRPAEKRHAQRFVLSVLDTVSLTTSLGEYCPGYELLLVPFMEEAFVRQRSRYDPAFFASVLAKWASPAVAGVLRARGSLQTAAAHVNQVLVSDEARRKGDVAARGFRTCGLPSCGKRETTVHHFKLCGGCDAVAYCCDEHHGVHWDGGHSRECRHLRAALAGAKPPSTSDGV